eukprot:SAG31_NODE_1869_length_7028_cov_2.847164_1_plen_59_part_00
MFGLLCFVHLHEHVRPYPTRHPNLVAPGRISHHYLDTVVLFKIFTVDLQYPDTCTFRY